MNKHSYYCLLISVMSAKIFSDLLLRWCQKCLIYFSGTQQETEEQIYNSYGLYHASCSLQVGCKVLHFFHMYMLGCNYFWMLCEGIYLHTLIVVAVFAEEQHLHWYYLLGWGKSVLNLPKPSFLCFLYMCIILYFISLKVFTCSLDSIKTDQ